MLKDEVNIVKDLPSHLKSLDFETIGSLVCIILRFKSLYMSTNHCDSRVLNQVISISCQITDADLPKEAIDHDYFRIVLPPLQKNGIVHLLGFGNRLGFDPLPSDLQVKI